MQSIHVVNYHITNYCNYRCLYCFGKFQTAKDPTPDEARRVVDTVCDYFQKHKIENGRLNLAGGEPMLYPHLDEVIDYAHKRGIAVSIITNGTHLTKERIQKWRGKVTCIGISIDSIDRNTNLKIGRHRQGKTVSIEEWESLAQTVHDCGITLKVNTVVSKLNKDENLSSLYQILKPERIKIFCMHLVKGVNDQATPYAITPQEYERFLDQHKAFNAVVVTEAASDMENSYLMIDPESKLLLNHQGKYTVFGSLQKNTLDALIHTLPFDFGKYTARYTAEVMP